LHLRRQARRVGLAVEQYLPVANADYFQFCPPLRRVAIVLDWLLERAGSPLGKLYFVVTLRKPVAEEGQRKAA
jgi:hypothetical protein